MKYKFKYLTFFLFIFVFLSVYIVFNNYSQLAARFQGNGSYSRNIVTLNDNFVYSNKMFSLTSKLSNRKLASSVLNEFDNNKQVSIAYLLYLEKFSDSREAKRFSSLMARKGIENSIYVNDFKGVKNYMVYVGKYNRMDLAKKARTDDFQRYNKKLKIVAINK